MIGADTDLNRVPNWGAKFSKRMEGAIEQVLKYQCIRKIMISIVLILLLLVCLLARLKT